MMGTYKDWVQSDERLLPIFSFHGEARLQKLLRRIWTWNKEWNLEGLIGLVEIQIWIMLLKEHIVEQ